MFLLLKYTLLYASVLALVGLGGMFAERSGVINIALEGIMVIGGLVGVIMINILNAAGVSPVLGVLISVLVAGVAGLVYSSLLAFSAVNLKADQTIGGTALNLLAAALAVVIAKRINGSDSPKITYNANSNAVFNNLDFSFNIGPLTLNWFVIVAAVAVVCAWFVLYRTRFGMRLMACGEHPQASASVGISVQKMRYAGVLISGLLGGLGGIVYITAGVSVWKFENGVAGFGFLAMAVMIFGAWHPLRIALAALLFGFLRALGNVYSGFDLLTALNIPSVVYNMLPYIISLVVLAFTSKKSRAPKAAGVAYDQGSR